MDPLLLTGTANTTIVIDKNKDGKADYQLQETHENGKQVINLLNTAGEVIKKNLNSNDMKKYKVGHIQSVSIYDSNRKFVKNGNWTIEGDFLGGIEDKSEPGKHSLKKINPDKVKNIFGD